MNETREHILKTSLNLFLKKSYRDVTMVEIVKRTGLSKGAFYHHFTSKEQLFSEIAQVFITAGRADYSLFRRDSLKAFYEDYIEHLDNSIKEMNSLITGSGTTGVNSYYILFEAVARFPEFLKKELELYAKEIEEWKAVIAEARRRGEINTVSSDEDVAKLFLYCNDGVLIRFINRDMTVSVRDLMLRTYNTIYRNLQS